MRRRERPLSKSLTEAAFVLALIASLLYGMKATGIVELGSGPLKVSDGDSLRRGETSIRLYGIDAPELNQTCTDEDGSDWRCGRQSADALRELIAGRDATCTAYDADRYGRSVAECKIGALNLSEEMVRQGWALAYRRHSFAFVRVEDEARGERRGIWRGGFENPESYRRRERIKRGDTADFD